MVEPYRDPDPNAPQNPPQSVLNPRVRRTALRTYLLPIVAFFAVVGVALAIWVTRPPQPDARDDRNETLAEGTVGERGRGDETPGGHNPDPTLDTPREELAYREGKPITQLADVVAEHGRGRVARRVELHGVQVARVDSPTEFWVRDGDTQLPVVVRDGTARLEPGQSVNLAGTIERAGDQLAIRASKVEAVK